MEMSILSPIAVAAAFSVILLLASGSATAAPSHPASSSIGGSDAALSDTDVLLRHHPTRVKWGEVEVAETRRVVVPMRDGTKKEFPWALSLGFSLKSRSEESPAGPGGEAPQFRTHAAPFGAVLLAGD